MKYNEEEIITLYKQGLTQIEIANRLGTYNTTIRRILLRHKITIRGNDKMQRLCKHNPFKKHDEKSDYFLGLLLTDGTITKTKNSTRNYNIVLSLNEQEKYMIEQFRNWASPNSKITKIYQKINGSYMCSVSFSNEEAVNWLNRVGQFKNKSYNCKVYKPLTMALLRGIFDGDGGWHMNGNSLDFFICGASLDFMKQIKYFLEKLNFSPHLRYTYSRSGKPFYYVELYKSEEVIKLGKMMYDNAHIYLKRKYDKWLAFYESKKANGVNSGKEMAIQP